jgi:hypothetical protein
MMKVKMFLLLLIAGVSPTGCGPNEREPNLFLVPNGYVGWLHIEYEVKSAPALPLQNGFRVYEFSRSGRIRTSSMLLEGVAKDKICYVTPNGWKGLACSDDQGKGMVWGGFTSSGGVHVNDSRGYTVRVPTPPTLNVFIGTWEQFSNRRTKVPQSKRKPLLYLEAKC